MSEKSKENDFWYEFDNTFNPDLGADKDFIEASGEIMSFSFSKNIGSLNSDRLTQFLKSNTEEIKSLKKAIERIATKYTEYFTTYFDNNFGDETLKDGSKSFDLFSAFGQGLLYDPRRSNAIRMHVMDGYSQYYVWHRFNWIGFLLNIPFSNVSSSTSSSSINNWIYLDRLVGAAAEIHSTAKPDQSCNIDGSPPENPKNGEALSISQINLIGLSWQNLYFDQIETRLSTLKSYESKVRCTN